MTTYIAFLRGINLGKRRPPMSQLKGLFEELKFSAVETFIASGNVVFQSKTADQEKLEARIAAHLETSLGYPVETFVRTSAEVVEVGRTKAFPEQDQPGITVHVAFLHQRLDREIARKLSSISTSYDLFKAEEREFYWLCRGGISDSVVWTLPEVKALRLPSTTMRNLTSIRKLITQHLEHY